jgi:hypothetical protein
MHWALILKFAIVMARIEANFSLRSAKVLTPY